MGFVIFWLQTQTSELHYTISFVLCGRLQKWLQTLALPLRVGIYVTFPLLIFDLNCLIKCSQMLFCEFWGWVSGELVHFLSALGSPALHSKWVVLVLPAEGCLASHLGHLWPANPQPIWKLTPDKWISPVEINQPWPDRQNCSVEPSANWQCIELS